MLENISNCIDCSDAFEMDDIFSSCSSIKKLIDTINSLLVNEDLPPNKILYFLILLFESFDEEEKVYSRIFKNLNFDSYSISNQKELLKVIEHSPLVKSSESCSQFFNKYNTKK